MKNVAWSAGLILTAAISAAVAAQKAALGPALVFFDWSKRDIRRDDESVLDKVAAEYAKLPNARLVLTGHSDRSGPDGANLRSSKRRAEAVRDYLVAHGVPVRAMTLQAYGEQQPIVVTEDGVREVQNRRVEIRLVPAG